MKMTFAATILTILAGGLVLSAQPTSTTSATTSATSQAASPEAMVILNRLEAAGAKYPNIVADVTYREDLVEMGDTMLYTGKVYYQAGADKEPGRFRIHFDSVREGIGEKAKTYKNVEDFVFDGAWLTTRKDKIKQQIRYQVAPPGETIDALQLGKGPFPVPFGQKAETMLKYFIVETRPSRDTDPAGTDYIKLTGRPEKQDELNVVWLEMYVQRAGQKQPGLPVRIVAEDRNENRKTVQFETVGTPAKHAADTFTLPAPGAGWEVRVEPYRK